MLFARNLLRTVPFAWPLFAALPAHAQVHSFVEPVPGEVTINGHTSTGAIRVWKLGCIADAESISDAEFHAVIDEARALEQSQPHVAPQQQSSTAQLGGFDVSFTVNSPPPGALAAVAAVEAYYDSRIASSHATGPVALTINFAPLSPITAMSTATSVFQVPWSQVRPNWVATMDADDVIEAFLPTTTIPVRFDGTSATVTNCTDVYMAAATLSATFPGVVGLPATHALITVNSNFTWDYDPTNGITAGSVCFQSALAHEVGHALGFNSAVDLPVTIPVQQDVFRFQRTTGNPTNYANFQTMTRLVDALPDDDAELDLVNFEYSMEDSTPFGAGHFREALPNIGLMDPALSNGETFYPEFLQTSDKRVLDALGYDLDDPGQSGLAHFVSLNRLDENPNSSDSVRWQLDFDKRVGNVNGSNLGVSGVAGAAVSSVTPIAGNAVTFMGLNWLDLFNFSAATSLGQGAFTAECSIRPTPQSTPAPTRTFLSFGSTTAGHGIQLTLDSNNRVIVEVSGLFYLWSSPVLNDGNWHHVAVTSSGGALATVNLFVDGAGAGSNLIPLNITSGSCAIGRTLLANPSINGMLGAVDEVRFWNQALSAGTLNAGRDLALPGSTPGLLGCFPLDVLANLGFSFPSLLDTPEETLRGGFGESNWAPGGIQPTLVAGRASGGKSYLVVASSGTASGTLTPSFTDNDLVVELRSGAPLNGPGTGSTNGQAYTIQHASGFSYGFGLGCPCGNDAPAGTNVGCLSSIGTGGKLRASGTASIGGDTFTLLGSQMPNATAVYMFAGVATNLQQFDGLLVVNNLLVRRTKTNVGGGSQFPVAGDPSISSLLGASAGQTHFFQVWYRNAATFCTSATSNYTNGWRTTWAP